MFPHEIQLATCSAEDLIVTKAFAGRDQDWFDVQNVIIRQQRSLNWRQILKELHPLIELKGTPETLERLSRYRDQPGS